MSQGLAILCPSCGAALGGRAGCQTHFDELGARAWDTPVRGAMHNLVVDAYALQHPDDYCRSPKSYAAHLTGLCCGLEHPGDQKLYWRISRWLDGPAAIVKPPVIEMRGRKDIRVVTGAADAVYQAAVREWASAVWAAYQSQQYLARGWLAEAARLR